MDARATPMPLQTPVQEKFIPRGVFIGIDETYYQPKDADPVKERPLKRHGTAVNVAGSEFVKQPDPISLSTGSLKTNYLSYIYDQLKGYQAGHPADAKTELPPISFF